MRPFRLIAVLFLAIAWFAQVSFLQAAIWRFEVNLDGLQVVPPNAGPGTAFAKVSLNDVTRAVKVTDGSFQGLLGFPTAATFNGYAPANMGANVLFNLTLGANDTFSGNGTLANAAAVADMLAGKTYLNIRTNVFPAGEVRGQIVEPAKAKIPEPSTLALLAVLAIACPRLRRRS